MSEFIKVLGVDPSVRSTGIAIVSYNTETKIISPPTNCQVLLNPPKFKGNDAILNMLDMIKEISFEECYRDCDYVIVESPGIMFNKNYSSSVIAMLGHISGGAVAILGLDKSYLFKPSEWNRSRKKDITHNKTQAVLGDISSWHFQKKIKSEKYSEHVLDAASMALWWIKSNFEESDE